MGCLLPLKGFHFSLYPLLSEKRKIDYGQIPPFVKVD